MAFRFLEESSGGTSAKFVVVDEHGARWKAKLGEEARSETAATRLLWAAGYIVDEDYYRTAIHVRDMRRLARGQEFVSADGTVSGVRLERPSSGIDEETWSWYDNPLIGTREFNGLRVLMALVNNWDLKEVNNVRTGTAASRVYGISDLGATFGRTGDVRTRSKGVAKDYADSPFIGTVTATHVDFVLHSRPFLPTIVHVPNYRLRTRMESIVKQIPLADARWIGERLSQLSAAQIGDCFRAGGFAPADVEIYTRAVLLRIAALTALGPPPSTSGTPVSDISGAKPVEASRKVPTRDTLTTIPLRMRYVRAIVGGFEQGAGLGGGVQLTSARALPVVEFRLTALTVTSRARRVDAGVVLPSIGGGRMHADAWVSYLRRDTDYFSDGPPTSLDDATKFTIDRRSLQASVYRDFAKHLQGGVYAQLMKTQSHLGLETTSSDVLSFGSFVAYDSRDTSDGLTRGADVYGRLATSDGSGSTSRSYGWFETEVDARGYVPLGSPRTSLVVRTRGQFKTPRSGSAVPYYDQSWLGGRTFLRGTPSYRYRGNNVVLFSSELQRTIVPFTPVRGVDIFGAADAGQSWNDQRQFRRGVWHTGLGGGCSIVTRATWLDASR